MQDGSVIVYDPCVPESSDRTNVDSTEFPKWESSTKQRSCSSLFLTSYTIDTQPISWDPHILYMNNNLRKIADKRYDSDVDLKHLLAQVEFYNPSQEVWIFNQRWMLMPAKMRSEKLTEAKKNVDEYMSNHPMIARKRKKEEETRDSRKNRIALKYLSNGFPT